MLIGVCVSCHILLCCLIADRSYAQNQSVEDVYEWNDVAKQWNGPFHGDGSWVVKKRPNQRICGEFMSPSSSRQP